MTSALDMSLDDLIKSNKSSRRRGGRGRGREAENRNGRSLGPVRSRGKPQWTNRAAPYTLSKPAQKNLLSSWQHDMFDEQMREAAAAPAPSSRLLKIETGTKLFVSNLDYGVSNEDIKELFSEVGDLKRSLVHYDRSGRSKGTAEVVFARRADAETAVKRYNNVQLDGKPLRLELIGTNLAVPAPNPPPRNGTAGNAIPAPVRWRGRGGAFRGSRGRGGRGRGGQWQRGEEKSIEDLDAELENYHAEAMQIN